MKLAISGPIYHPLLSAPLGLSRHSFASTSQSIVIPSHYTSEIFILTKRCDNLNRNCPKTRRRRRRRGTTFMSMDSESSIPLKPFGVLFVCLGNICRSPTAEAVFCDAVQKRGLASRFKIDSAGTIDYHEGKPADPRMRSAAKKRGIEITSISRPISPSDFKEFDLILAMDKQNKADILRAYEEWEVEYSLPVDANKKVRLMCFYCKQCKETEVPDPYYGGPQGFEKVLDILKDACESLLDEIVQNDFQDVSVGSS